MTPRKTEPRPLAVDLFCGAGGMSLGFEQAGFDVVAAVDNDPIHCAVHEYNFPESTTLCRDVREVSGQELKRIAVQRGGQGIAVVFGGPPCQGFSLIGKRALDDPRNRLVTEFARIVQECGAPYFVLENVRGLTVGKHRHFLEEVVDVFSSMGYCVRLPWQVLNSAEYGVPQDRRRLFLLGARRDLPLPDYPAPTTTPAGNEDGLFSLPRTPTVGDALCDLPDAENFSELMDSDKVRVAFETPSGYGAILRGLTLDPEDFSYPRNREGDVMTGSLRTKHTDRSRRRFARTQPGAIEPTSRFFKLDPDGICNTLRAGTGSDRGAFTSPRPIHPKWPRCITVREMARLHSYPDWFRFHATKWHGARQVGNSVPPLLARAVAAEVIRVLGEAKPQKPARTLDPGAELLLHFAMKDACAYFGVGYETMPRRTRKTRSAATLGAEV